jgi:hypothetical protein
MIFAFGRQPYQNTKIRALSILLLTILGVLAGISSFTPPPLLAQEVMATQLPHRVLILNSYHPGMVFSDQEMDGIRSTLPRQTEIFFEYMDSKREQGRDLYSPAGQVVCHEVQGLSF